MRPNRGHGICERDRIQIDAAAPQLGLCLTALERAATDDEPQDAPQDLD